MAVVAVVIVVVIVIVIALVVILSMSLRLFSVERVDTNQESPFNLPDAPDDPADGQEDGEADGEPEKKGEMVNLFDYFDEDGNKTGENQGESGTDSASGSDSSAMHSSTNSTDATGGGSPNDKLTDLKTGRAYLVDCKKILEIARNEGHIYCACYFDYDRFAYINSLKGALTGDYVLTHTAQNIRNIFPEDALLSRISCDHFIAVFPLVDVALFEGYYEQLNSMCEKIHNEIAVKTGLRICVGFACSDNDASYDINVLTARANVARHCVKVTKAEKFEIFDESMTSSNFYGDTLVESYGECQYSDDFVLYFERQMEIQTDKIFGCDTLVRWVYDDKNAVANNNPITQDNGHIPTNNAKVIYHVCRAISRWRKAAREQVLVFVDLPVVDLFKVDIDEFLVKCLTEFQVDPQTLAVKVDASCIRLDWSACSHQFRKIRDIGVKLCLCGVDTGYTNLEFLAGLTVDYVKLHKSFAYEIEKSQEQADKCHRIIERITNVGAKAIFEGVSTSEQISALKSVNAKLIQGRYTGKLANADELARDLPEHIERRGNETVVLNDAQLAKGDFKMF